MCLKEESVCEIEMSQGIMPYQIHSILPLLVIWHPSLVSLHSQGLREKIVEVHIISLGVGQFVIEA